eukprot:TRINITY_DN5607_c0_g1_i5.p1 TRINITY_DN5607_c0_g1~~TRINITY_DN5607_c0_g1_i5.p1  ORF type:complete len:152 (-),score=23.08 TRINITY_DN5607_c0_g1_i5:75-530(-)
MGGGDRRWWDGELRWSQGDSVVAFCVIRQPPRSTLSSSSAASDVYKRQVSTQSTWDFQRISNKKIGPKIAIISSFIIAGIILDIIITWSIGIIYPLIFGIFCVCGFIVAFQLSFKNFKKGNIAFWIFFVLMTGTSLAYLTRESYIRGSMEN